MSLDLNAAGAVLDAALADARARALKPLGVVVLGADECVRAVALEDGATGLRFDIARAKAVGALRMRRSSRALEQFANERPGFFQSLSTLNHGMVIPAAGGVLIADGEGALIGAIGVSGDTSDNDEACAVAALSAHGLNVWTE